MQAEALYNSIDQHFPIPPSAYMDTICCWELVHLYKLGPDFWNILTFSSLCAKTPLLQMWSYREKSGQLLVEQLQDFIKEVDKLQIKMKIQKMQKRNSSSYRSYKISIIRHLIQMHIITLQFAKEMIPLSPKLQDKRC